MSIGTSEKCPLYGGVCYNVSATEMFFFQSLIGVSSVPKKSVRYTEVSAI